MKQKRPHTLLNQGAKKPRIFQCYFHLVFCRFSLKLSSSLQILTAQGKEFDFASWKQSQISTKKSFKTQNFFFFSETNGADLYFLFKPDISLSTISIQWDQRCLCNCRIFQVTSKIIKLCTKVLYLCFNRTFIYKYTSTCLLVA